MFKILNNRFLYFMRRGLTMFPTPEYNQHMVIPLSYITRVTIDGHEITVSVLEVSEHAFKMSSKEETEAKFQEIMTALNGGNPVLLGTPKTDLPDDAALENEDKAPPYPPYTEYEELLPPKPEAKDVGIYKPTPDAWAVAQLR